MLPSASVKRCFVSRTQEQLVLMAEKSRMRETKNLLTNMDSSTDTKKILLSKAKFAQGEREGGKICPGRGGREEGKICPKFSFFCAAISHPLLVKVFTSETTSFHYFPHIFQISKNFGHPTLGSGGKKVF